MSTQSDQSQPQLTAWALGAAEEEEALPVESRPLLNESSVCSSFENIRSASTIAIGNVARICNNSAMFGNNSLHFLD